jgi:SAM-dependent methyltransferase
MVWAAEQPYCPESKKIVWEIAPYLRGQGIDVGAGSFKILPHAISVDNGCDNVMFGIPFKADVSVKSADTMPIFGTQSLDWVYSSHLLEHLDDPEKALKEWWRVLKVKGLLILYLPHEDLYPKVGEPGANPDHKCNLNEQKVIDWMLNVGKWDLIRCEQRNENEEYSFLMIFKKRDVGHLYSYKEPKPEGKRACVVRYGAFGDLIQTASVLAALKKEGYHVTLFASPPGSDVVLHDPNIDEMILFDKDQVPNADLGSFWDWQKKKFDKWVNLSESVEGSLLAMKGRTMFEWTPVARHAMLNKNYIEMAHKIAGVPYELNIKFYATDDEKAWAKKQRAHIGADQLVMWSLAGSSVHKTWAGLDHIIASVLVTYPKASILLVGGPECVMLEAGWENEPRVFRTCGKWTIRQTFAMLAETDLLIGPETGVLNAAACMDMEKIIFLSHSTHENLTRDWKNVTALTSSDTTCPGRGKNEAPACHQMHYGFGDCKRDEASGVAQCQADILVPDVWAIVNEKMKKIIDHQKMAA